MKTDTYQSDLYVLPESKQEEARIIAFLDEKNFAYKYSLSNIEGQDWFGQMFIEIPFGATLKEEISNLQIPNPEEENTNVKMGFNDMTEWCKNNPGTRKFSCQWCGIYEASKARCSYCNEDE